MSKSPAKAAIKEIRHDIDDVLDDVVHSLRKLAKHVGEDASDELSKTTAGLADAAVKLADEAKVKGKALAKAAGQEVKEHPAATAAIAAAAVALIGLAIARRGKSKD